MQLFDNEIVETINLLSHYQFKDLLITEDLLEDVGKNNMVFSNEAAYELGSIKSLSFELPSSTYIDKDELLLLGKDLNQIKEDTPFIRLTLLNVKEDKELKGDQLYDRLEKIKFTKYRVSLKGYMLRTATKNQEKVRVSVDASKYSFSNIGSSYIKAYHLLPYVNHVKIIFITEENELFDKLVQLGKRKDEITQAIDHILKGMLTNDCGSCSVKELCDEVQGLREIHNNS